ncbi:hypothetical protein [Actinokineospora sp. NBRC 105648]|nr:hypothetical protein [Actinokineospora sp. NBRC 105648]GLZ40566.1 hypothetical protein Acsp05_41900 [Actinokineospora sp. NBRC 105648]
MRDRVALVKGVSKVHELEYHDGFIKDLHSPHGIPEGDVPLPLDDGLDE